MSFRVAARTVLELGAELISSDAVAIYELVKNAIDAESLDGVTVEFCITLRHSDYMDALARAGDLTSRGQQGKGAQLSQNVEEVVFQACFAVHRTKKFQRVLKILTYFFLS